MKPTRKSFRPRRDFEAMEKRRMEAARLFAEGKSQAEVARELGVSRQSVSRWHARYRGGGARRLRGAGRAGRKPKLNPRQLGRLESALRKGARAHGFETDLWTLPRVVQVIEGLTGVRYHPGHAWRVLRGLGARARRGGPAEMGPGALARYKKKPGAPIAGSASRTRAELASGLPAAAPGPPGERRRS